MDGIPVTNQEVFDAITDEVDPKQIKIVQLHIISAVGAVGGFLEYFKLNDDKMFKLTFKGIKLAIREIDTFIVRD